jgi:hypothetical protein
MIPLSESSEGISHYDNKSDSTSSSVGQKKKRKLDDKLKSYRFM